MVGHGRGQLGLAWCVFVLERLWTFFKKQVLYNVNHSPRQTAA